MATARDLLALMEVHRLGRRSLSKILRACSDALDEVDGPADLTHILGALSKRVPLTRIPDRSEIDQCYNTADQILKDAEKYRIQVIGHGDQLYPDRLRRLEDPPAVIYVLGDPLLLHAQLSIAIVGTREPTNFGTKCGERLGKVIGETGVPVVSGLALGCDSAAHRGCLLGGGKTIAVLAHGLERVYPKQNTELASQIVETGGCVFSTYRPLSRPFPSNFVERDALQVALSDGVIVVETDVKGGTMHTVRFCLEQGKPLACLQHPEAYHGRPQTRGNQHLISEESAVPISDTNSLLGFWLQVQSSAGIIERSHPPRPNIDLANE